MKRLLAQIGITAFSALAVAFYLPEKAKFIALMILVVITILFMIVRPFRRTVYLPAMAVTAALACIVNIAYGYLAVAPIQEANTGEDQRIVATIAEEAYGSGKVYYYRLNTESIGGREVRTKLIYITSMEIDAEPFDKIVLRGDVEATDNSYYLSKGYYLTVDDYIGRCYTLTADSRPLYYPAIRLRRFLRSALDSYLPEDVASLCKAIMVGDKYALSAEVRADFRYAGASHFVVVSGMHFSIVCLLFITLFRKNHALLRRKIALSLALALVAVYMTVTGFQPSVIRSAVMVSVYVMSLAIKRINYAHNSLGLAGLALPMLFSPYAAGDIGLILSFGASFGIITWCDAIYRRLRIKKPSNMYIRSANWVIKLLSVSLSANIIVFPISVFVFKGVSTVTLISALVLYVPVMMILIGSIALCFFYALGPLKIISQLISYLILAAGRFILLTVDGLASLPFSYVFVGETYVFIWVILSILLGLIVLACGNRYKYLPAAALISLSLLIGGAVYSAVDRMDTVSLNVYECKNGLAVGFDYHGKLYMLACDANSNEVYELFSRKLSLRYGEAELAVCSRKRDLSCYSRLTQREFATRELLLYCGNIFYDYRSDDLDAVNNSHIRCEYELGEAHLTVIGQSDKLMSYLEVNGHTVLVLPRKFPAQNIPDDMLSADYIILCDTAKGYEALDCERLIISDTSDDTFSTAKKLSGTYRYYEAAANGDVVIDLR